MKSFDEHWQLFAKLNFAGLAEHEMAAARSVFYAGGVSVFGFMTEHVAALAHDQAHRAMDGLHREFIAFATAERERERDPDTRH